MYVFMIVYDFELQFQLSSYHLLRDVPTSPRTSIHPELRRIDILYLGTPLISSFGGELRAPRHQTRAMGSRSTVIKCADAQ